MDDKAARRPSSAELQAWAACATDMGQGRTANEDRCLISPERDLFIVADGMGGQQAGEVAAEAVVSLLPTLLRQRVAGAPVFRRRVAELLLREAILDLSRRLWSEGTVRPELRGLGATVAVVWLRPPFAHLAHMGDSRIYLYRGGHLAQSTEDHSVVALLVRSGEVSPEAALHHPARNQLSRYVGMEGDVYADVRTIQLQPGDRLLLCTDGLTRPLADERIAAVLAGQAEPEAACRALVAAASAAGGADNITALAVDWR